METPLNFMSLKDAVEKNHKNNKVHFKNLSTNTLVDVGRNNVEILSTSNENLKIIYDKTEAGDIVYLKSKESTLKLSTKASLSMINVFLKTHNIGSTENIIKTVEDLISGSTN